MKVGYSRIWGLKPTTQTKVGGAPHKPYKKEGEIKDLQSISSILDGRKCLNLAVIPMVILDVIISNMMKRSFECLM